MNPDKARAAADEYRRFWGKEGGYVFVFQGVATCWCPDLPPVTEWRLGTLAVAGSGEILKRVLGSPQWEEIEAPRPPGPRCHCGSTNTVPTGFGGYQAPDASKGDPGADGDEYGCDDCGRLFIW